MKIKKIRSQIIKYLPVEDGIEYKIRTKGENIEIKISYEGWMETEYMPIYKEILTLSETEIIKLFKEECVKIIEDLKKYHNEKAPIQCK